MANDFITPYIVKIQARLGNGSGVVVKDEQGKYYIFTAKHNFKSTENQKNEEIEIEDIREEIEFDEVKIISYHEIEVNDALGLDDLSIDFVVLVVDKNSFDYLNTLPIQPLKIYNDKFKECIVSGYPKISEDTIYIDCKYQTRNKEYEKRDDYKHTFKVSSIDTLYRSGKKEIETISGISGGGVFVKGEDEVIHLVGIEIEYIDIHNLVCVSLKDVIEEINTQLDVLIQLASTDGIKANEVDTTLKEYHLTIECIPKNEKFQITIFTNNDNRMKETHDEKSYTKDEIAILIDDFVKENKPSHIHNGSVFLLFVLPIALMSEHIGNWKVGDDRLADKYTIMLRGQERFRDKNKHLYAFLSDWKIDWENCFNKRFEPIKNIICEKYDSTDSIDSQEIEDYPLIVFGYNIKKEMFEQLYRRGVSRAIWVSEDVKSKKFKKLFKKKNLEITDIKFGKLHNNLYKFKKKEKKIGSHIMFLYDNPNELPLDDSDMAQINPI